MSNYIVRTLPIFWVAGTVAICCFYIVSGSLGYQVSYQALGIWNLVTILSIWHWIYFEAPTKGVHRPFSFGMLLQIYWMAILPWYFIKTRGWLGIPILIGLFILFAAPSFCLFFFGSN